MSYQMQRITVLVVEDNQPMLEITKSMLLAFGVGQVVTAREGGEGYGIFCKTNPDIVIVDWMMKPVDGISMARRIRSDPKSPNPFVPVILMTGFTEKKRVFQARDAGVTEFLVKPFGARDLYKRIAQLVERPRQFVRSEDFFGPDRRRRRDLDHHGPFRRENDFMNPDLAPYRVDRRTSPRGAPSSSSPERRTPPGSGPSSPGPYDRDKDDLF
jgi:two-component system chemotaxis response regulator CheY